MAVTPAFGYQSDRPPPDKPKVQAAALGEYGRAGPASVSLVGWSRRPCADDPNFCHLDADVVVIAHAPVWLPLVGDKFVLIDPAGNIQQPEPASGERDEPGKRFGRIYTLGPGESERRTIRYRVPATATGLRMLAADRAITGKAGKNDFIPLVKLVDPGEAAKAGGKVGGEVGEGLGAGAATIADVGILTLNGMIVFANIGMWLSGEPAQPSIVTFDLGDRPTNCRTPARPKDIPVAPLSKPDAEVVVKQFRLQVTEAKFLPAVESDGQRRLQVQLTVRSIDDKRTLDLKNVAVIDQLARWTWEAPHDEKLPTKEKASWPFYEAGVTRTLTMVFCVPSGGEKFHLRLPLDRTDYDDDTKCRAERIELAPR